MLCTLEINEGGGGEDQFVTQVGGLADPGLLL
jgi:hypothetical protein